MATPSAVLTSIESPLTGGHCRAAYFTIPFPTALTSEHFMACTGPQESLPSPSIKKIKNKQTKKKNKKKNILLLHFIFQLHSYVCKCVSTTER